MKVIAKVFDIETTPGRDGKPRTELVLVVSEPSDLLRVNITTIEAPRLQQIMEARSTSQEHIFKLRSSIFQGSLYWNLQGNIEPFSASLTAEKQDTKNAGSLFTKGS